MLKSRLIFSLLYSDGSYMLSRNFRLQKAGGLAWLKSAYNFDAIAYSIDELVVVNVQREGKDVRSFAGHLSDLSKECFMPITAGGGIRSLEDGYALMHAGADKLIINSIVFDNPSVVSELASTFGNQAVVVSLDCKKVGNSYRVFSHDGSLDTGLTLAKAIKKAEKLGAGELYVTSIDRDGTGQGYDIPLLKAACAATRLPVIAAGGVGKYEHFLEGIQKGHVAATATANIYNFLVDGLIRARKHLRDHKVPMAVWDYNLSNLRRYFKKSKTT